MMNRKINYAPTSRGLSLVELMVALVIGLVISIGVFQVFSSTRVTYQLDEALARVQENGRFAMEFLTQDIRHAGHLGCRRNAKVFNSLKSPDDLLYPISGVIAFEYTYAATGPGATYNAATVTPNNSVTFSNWTPTLTYVPSGALPGTDVVAVQKLVPNPMPLVAPYADKDKVYLDPAYVDGTKDNIKADDILMLSDCREAVIFQVTNADLTTGALSHDTSARTPGNRCGAWENNVAGSSNATGSACTELFANPQAQVEIGKFETVVFYVARDPISLQPTLYRNVLNGSIPSPGQPLVEGIESFQVLYGVDDVAPADGVPDHYVTASVANPAQIVSVKIGVLIHGVNSAGTANETTLDTEIYNVAGTNINPTPDDNRRRRVFSTTLQLRNRGY